MTLRDHLYRQPVKGKMAFVEETLKEALEHVKDKDIKHSLRCAITCMVTIQIAYSNMQAVISKVDDE